MIIFYYDLHSYNQLNPASSYYAIVLDTIFWTYNIKSYYSKSLSLLLSMDDILALWCWVQTDYRPKYCNSCIEVLTVVKPN